ncbi:unnamed protein product [Hymenolepis diminuta]|uniref:Reverse transcriptase domain-containing protein n=1 Tax=Hymenolepis diminuta TaxID=6216 RepID=A0A0R3SFS7_HYMDI|nr:unnamed protein product [Hymenolepis diminuta]
MPILRRTSLSSRLPYRRRCCQNCNDNGHKEGFYEQFNEAEPEQQESIKSDEAELWSALANTVQIYASMRCEATSLEKGIFKECYVRDRNMNLMGLDWIDELNLIPFPDENESCQTPSLKSTNAENLVRGCKQCLHVVEIPHPPFRIQSPEPDSPRTLDPPKV